MNLFYIGYFTMLIGLVLVYQDASAGLLVGVVGAAQIFFWLLSKWFNINISPKRLDIIPLFGNKNVDLSNKLEKLENKPIKERPI